MDPQSSRSAKRPPHVVSLALALLLSWVAGAAPQSRQPPSTTTSTQPAAQEEDRDVGFDSPRATMRGFLYAARAGDWDSAAAHLDLRGRDPEGGPRLARQMKTVLDRKLWVDLDALSDAPEGEPNDGETAARDLVGTIAMSDGRHVKILVERVPAPDGTRQWKIARVTLQQLPALWAAFGNGVLSEWLPRPFFAIRFLDTQLWQWIALALALLASAVLAWLLTAPMLRLIQRSRAARRHRSMTSSRR
jgi:MscS family membrane protein